MKKKYIIVSLVSILVLTIGVSFAYIRGVIVAKNKSNISLRVKELYVIFKDETEISEHNIDLGWEKTKSFSVENQGDATFYYNIKIEDLINTLESNGLQYKINSSNGYNMEEFKSVPKSNEKKDTILISNISIKGEETQEYTITFKYIEDPVIDQSNDMGESFSGRLGITEGGKPTIGETLLAGLADSTDAGRRTDFSKVFTTAGVYWEEGGWTEGGTRVYYYTGDADNWVKFANLYWRIIRSNEDGSLRLLYAGTSPEAEDAYITDSKAFNTESSNPMYVGLKYGTSESLANNRTNDNPSTILGSEDDETTLYGWYKSKIQDAGFGDWVSKSAIYCNDRAVVPGTYSTSNSFDYAAYMRLGTNKRPSFKCGVNSSGGVIEETQNVADKFSADKSSGGNGQLTYPVGLMTADEIAFAGGLIYTKNSSAYYYRNANGGSSTGTYYWWLASPDRWFDSFARVFFVNGSVDPGRLSNYRVSSSYAVRPVVSLKSCATIKSGNGTSDTPYEFSIDNACKEAVN